MCIDYNPWKFPENDKSVSKSFIAATETVFLFSGVVAQPDLKKEGLDARQYSSDKIRSV